MPPPIPFFSLGWRGDEVDSTAVDMTTKSDGYEPRHLSLPVNQPTVCILSCPFVAETYRACHYYYYYCNSMISNADTNRLPWEAVLPLRRVRSRPTTSSSSKQHRMESRPVDTPSSRGKGNQERSIVTTTTTGCFFFFFFFSSSSWEKTLS